MKLNSTIHDLRLVFIIFHLQTPFLLILKLILSKPIDGNEYKYQDKVDE